MAVLNLRIPPLFLIALVVVVAFALPLGAQDHRLMRALNSSDFRVRVQATIALGTKGDPSARPYLEARLADSHQSVRTAALVALARLGSIESISAIRPLLSDPAPKVRKQAARVIAHLEKKERATTPRATVARATPRASRGGFYPAVSIVPKEDEIAWPQVRYAVVLGDLVNRSSFHARDLESQFRAQVTRHLRLLRRVAVFSSQGEIDATSRRQMQRLRIPTVNVAGNIVSLQRRRQQAELAVKCQVSLLILDRGQNLKGMLNGSATAQEPAGQTSPAVAQEERLASQALGGAVGSAMSTAPQAISHAANR